MKKYLKCAATVALLAAGAVTFTSCGSKKDSNKSYTYRTTTTAPTTWSPTDWQLNQEDVILQRITTMLYDYVANETKDGYKVVPEMASALPVDVTKEYAGNELYGVPADAEEGWAWKISLNKKATWDDGTKIDASTYEYSFKQFLNPDMKNFRASSYYESLPLVNAKNYYAGSVAYDNANEAENVNENDLWSSLTQPVFFLEGETLNAYGPDSDYADVWTNEKGENLWEKLFANASGKTYFKVTPEVKSIYQQIAKGFGDDSPDAWLQFCFTRTEKEATPWEEVGFIKNDDYTITFVLSHAMTPFNFIYATTGIRLVKEDLYEANKQQTGDITKSKYGTSKENTASYGPYKIDSYQADKSISCVKNENWYGWTDGKHNGQFMTTGYEIQFMADHATILNLFLQGKLDEVELSAVDMEKYGNSDYRKITPQSYTYKFSFNIDRKSLERENSNGIVHTPIANINFRHAVSLSLDRQKWVETTAPASDAGYGLVNYLYVAIPESGMLYRDTEVAKNVLTEFYGTSSVEDITGYDLVAAKKYFQTAYDEEIKAGYLKPTDKVQIDYHAYAASEGNQRRASFLQDAINAATEGTGFEKKITIKLVVDQNYYDNMKTGNVDLAYTAWGGADFDPYGILWCYNTKEALNEYGFNPETESLTINIEGKDITKTYKEWYEEITTGEYADASYDVKNIILSANEKAHLERYNMIPVEYYNILTLGSQRVVEYSEKYINSLVLHGDLRLLTYTMDDAEWDAYCAENNNQLQY